MRDERERKRRGGRNNGRRDWKVVYSQSEVSAVALRTINSNSHPSMLHVAVRDKESDEQYMATPTNARFLYLPS